VIGFNSLMLVAIAYYLLAALLGTRQAQAGVG
jgi:hypothetical protein